MKKYLKDLKNALLKQKISNFQIAEIMKDHEDMIKDALSEGLKEEELVSRFGEPEDIARSLAEDVMEDMKEKLNDEKPIESSYKFESETDAFKVNIELSSETIYIKSSDDQFIHVDVEGDQSVDPMKVTYDDQTLNVQKEQVGISQTISYKDDKVIYISLPVSKTISSIMVKLISGDFEIKDLSCGHLGIRLISGDITIKSLIADSIKLNTVSGDSTLSKVVTDKLHVSQVSGDLEIDDLKAELELELHTVSGDIEIEDVSCDLFDLDSVSGDVEAKEFYPKTVRFKSVSGDLDIDNKSKREIKIISKKTLTGDINIDL